MIDVADYSRKKARCQHFRAKLFLRPILLRCIKLTKTAKTSAAPAISENRTTGKASDSPRPILGGESDGFVARLEEVIGDKSVSSFSRRSQIGESVIRGYLTLGKRPRLDHLVSLADAGNVLVDWLATGRGPKTRADLKALQEAALRAAAPHAPDPARLRLALTMAEDAATLIPEPLTTERRADLAMTFYQRLTGE